MALAVIHVIGALGVSIAFSVLAWVIAAWEQERVKKRRLQDASLALGVPVSAVKNDESLAPQVLEYASKRFSGELLRNRLSDLCGLVRTLWGVLGAVVQAVVIAGVAWATYTNGKENAIYMWWVPVISIFFWLAAVAFSFACLLLTGRYPGEAKMARKALVAFIEQRNTSPHRTRANGVDY